MKLTAHYRSTGQVWYPGICAAARALGVSHPHLWLVLRGRGMTRRECIIGGWRWSPRLLKRLRDLPEEICPMRYPTHHKIGKQSKEENAVWQRQS